MKDIGRILVMVGIAIAVLGVVMTFAGRTPLDRLPGDLVYKRDHFTFYFPLMTSLLLSVILTLILWLFRR
ncbi:MAG: DUF2905 domain-containing protein [Thermoanaerobaculia bacterium]